MAPGGARFDKDGNPLPDTGHGCGCQICADAARVQASGSRRPWTAAQRRVVELIKKLTSDSRSQTA